MGPNINKSSTDRSVLQPENPFAMKSKLESELNSKDMIDSYKVEIVWPRAIGIGVLHFLTLYGIYIILTEHLMKLYIYALLLGVISMVGVTGGAHRLWTHRSYKAKWPMRLILMLLQTMCYQNSIHEWVRDHRVHHKFTDTNADPHNSRRGFFFSHVGWLMIKKHPDVKLKGKTIDMSDIEADPIVMFQKNYFFILMPLFTFILPPLMPMFLWGYTFRQCFIICSILRYVLSLNLTWFVNSAAHLWGFRQYDKNINPRNNRFVISIAIGEGYHNYHHVFPWDYKAAEMGSYFFNLTKVVIDLCAKIGWAYDLKTAPKEMIYKRILRTGDGSHSVSTESRKYEDLIKELDHEKEEQLVWGWDDKDLTDEDKKDAVIINKCY